jgi:hypothetical protein
MMYHFDICHTLEMQRVWMSGNARVVFAPWGFRGGEKCVTRLKLHVTYRWPKRHAHHVDVALQLRAKFNTFHSTTLSKSICRVMSTSMQAIRRVASKPTSAQIHNASFSISRPLRFQIYSTDVNSSSKSSQDNQVVSIYTISSSTVDYKLMRTPEIDH